MVACGRTFCAHGRRHPAHGRGFRAYGRGFTAHGRGLRTHGRGFGAQDRGFDAQGRSLVILDLTHKDVAHMDAAFPRMVAPSAQSASHTRLHHFPMTLKMNLFRMFG